MAIQAPGISYLKGYDRGDPLAKFAAGHAWGKGLKDEADAPEAFAAYLDSLQTGVGTSQSTAMPGSDRMVYGAHAAAESATDPMLEAYFANTRRAESGGNDQARNPNSTATGRYQVLEGTWADYMNRYPELGLTPEGREDPQQQERFIRQFTADNSRALQQGGVQVNPGSLYAAHFLGPGAAPKVLNGDPASPVSAYVDPAVIEANPQLADMTVADFQQWAAQKGGNGSGGYQPPMGGNATVGENTGQGMPPRDVMLKLFSNPVTRPLAINAVKTAQTTGKPTAAITEYMFALGQGYQGTFQQWQNANKDGTNVTVNTGASDKFYETMDADLAKQNTAIIERGANARTNNIRLGQLQSLLETAPQGAQGAFTQLAGSVGIPIEGLNDVQAAEALISQMVPGQRAPGSGTMSDADLALYKRSLPQLINQPGGNQLILQTMQAINEYEIALSDIAQQVANREMTPADGRKAMARVPNPLANFKAAVGGNNEPSLDDLVTKYGG